MARVVPVARWGGCWALGPDDVAAHTMNAVPDAPAPLRVLMVCYHFPPMPTTGGLRPARFVKYFPPHVQADVLTVQLTESGNQNVALYEEVADRVTLHRASRWDWLAWKGPKAPRGLLRFMEKVRKTLLSMFVWIPDRQVAWTPPALRLGRKLLQQGNYDVIFCTSPPHSIQVVGRNLKRASGVPLVVDFRDPWTDNPQRRWRTEARRSIERSLEWSVLKEADAVIANTPGNREMLLNSFPGLWAGKLHVITNGFDPDRRAAMQSRPETATDERRRKRIVFTGHAYEGTEAVLRSLGQLLEYEPGLMSRVVFRFVGSMDPRVERLVRKLPAEGAIELAGFVSADRITEEIAAADALLYTVPEAGVHWVPSKLYDYMLADKPILAVLPRGDAWSFLEPTGLATLVETGSARRVTAGMGAFLRRLEAGELQVAPQAEAIERFDVRRLAAQLVDVMSSVARRR